MHTATHHRRRGTGRRIGCCHRTRPSRCWSSRGSDHRLWSGTPSNASNAVSYPAYTHTPFARRANAVVPAQVSQGETHWESSPQALRHTLLGPTHWPSPPHTPQGFVHWSLSPHAAPQMFCSPRQMPSPLHTPHLHETAPPTSQHPGVGDDYLRAHGAVASALGGVWCKGVAEEQGV